MDDSLEREPPQTPDEQFYDLLDLAVVESLSVREASIFRARYGMGLERDPKTLAVVGMQHGVSRERIRQILKKCIGKFRRRAARYLRNEDFSKPTAQLFALLKSWVRPEAPKSGDALIAMGTDEGSFAYLQKEILMLIVSLLYRSVEAKALNTAISLGIKRYLSNQAGGYDSRYAVNMLNKALWPAAGIPGSYETCSQLTRKRSVNEHGGVRYGLEKFRPKSGEFFSAKLHRVVQYESIMELTFLSKLEAASEVVCYSEQPFAIPYEYGTYYPDVFVALSDGAGIVVELKPLFEMGLQINLLKWRALWQFCKSAGYGFLVTDGRWELTEIKRRFPPSMFEGAILRALRRGPLSWEAYRSLRDAYLPGRDEFLAIILRNRLVWNLSPFNLRLEVQPPAATTVLANVSDPLVSSEPTPDPYETDFYPAAYETIDNETSVLNDAIGRGLLGDTHGMLLDSAADGQEFFAADSDDAWEEELSAADLVR